jgi:hypothetical protein
MAVSRQDDDRRMMFRLKKLDSNFLSSPTPFCNHRGARIWFQLVEKVFRNHIDE